MTLTITFAFDILISVVNVYVSVHGTLKLEIRNWKFSLHAFVLLMSAFNFGPSFSAIALYYVAFDPDKTLTRFISSKFLLSNFEFQAVNGYLFIRRKKCKNLKM